MSPISEGALYNETGRNAGEIAEHHPAEYITSRIAEGAIAFGQALVPGTAEGQVKIPAASTDKFCGAAALSFEATDLDDEAYADGDPLGLVEIGVVMVHVEEAVDPSDPVRIRHTAVTGKPAGVFCTTAEPGKTALLTGAEFKGSTTGAGIVPLLLKGIFTTTPDAA